MNLYLDGKIRSNKKTTFLTFVRRSVSHHAEQRRCEFLSQHLSASAIQRQFLVDGQHRLGRATRMTSRQHCFSQ